MLNHLIDFSVLLYSQPEVSFQSVGTINSYEMYFLTASKAMTPKQKDAYEYQKEDCDHQNEPCIDQNQVGVPMKEVCKHQKDVCKEVCEHQKEACECQKEASEHQKNRKDKNFKSAKVHYCHLQQCDISKMHIYCASAMSESESELPDGFEKKAQGHETETKKCDRGQREVNEEAKNNKNEVEDDHKLSNDWEVVDESQAGTDNKLFYQPVKTQKP